MSTNPNNIRAATDRNRSNTIRVVANKIWMCNTHDLWLTNKIGIENAHKSSKFRFPRIEALEYEWFERGNTPRSNKITAPVAAPASQGLDCFNQNVYGMQTIPVSNPERYFKGMVVYATAPAPASNLAPWEYMYIHDVDYNLKTITVTRGWRGTPVYSYPVNHEICVLTIVAEECPDHVVAYNPLKNSVKNYRQLFVSGLSQSERSKDIKHYGDDMSQYDELMTRIMGGTMSGKTVTGELPFMLEMAAWYGLPSPGGSGGDSSFGGINSFPINQVVVPQLELDTLNDAIQLAFENGADIPSLTIVCGPRVKRQISTWGEGYIRTMRTETSIGQTVDRIVTDFGEVGVEVFRHLRPNEVYIMDTSEMSILEFQPFTEVELAKTNILCEDRGIWGEYGFALACPCHHTRIRIDSACLPDGSCDIACFNEPAASTICEPGQVAP